MQLPPGALALLLGALGPAAAADEHLLRGLQASAQSGILATGSCVLNARSEMRIPGADADDADASEFEESLACMSAQGHVTPIVADATQMTSVLALAASGALTFGETEVDLGSGIQAASSDPDGGIVLAKGFEIQVVTGPQGPRGGGKRRRGLQGADTLERHFVVFRVTDSAGAVNPDSAAAISDNMFGTSGDQVNLKSQMHACSNGKYTVVPGIYEDARYDFADVQAAPGVVEITMSVTHDAGGTGAGGGINPMVAAAQAKFAAAFGTSDMLQHLDHALFVVPAGNYGWAAYAYVNSWAQVYQGGYYALPGVQLHEHGHNMALAHSGGLDGQPYTDHTCLMGNPLYSDEVGQMCFNPAKNWQLQMNPESQVIESWYDDAAFLELDPAADLPRAVKMLGIGEYSLQPTPPIAVALKILPPAGVNVDPVYVGFNSAAGANSENDEADNEVTLIQKGGDGYMQSWLLAHLVADQAYVFEGVRVEAKCIDVAVTPSVACVCVRRAAETCPPCTCDVGPMPPPTASPTKAPVAPTPPPTVSPTPPPTVSPTKAPVASTPPPTVPPTPPPTMSPTKAPVAPTPPPTVSPTPPPTSSPTKAPMAPIPPPTVSPTPSPTVSPTKAPTVPPTVAPTKGPTPPPTVSPTVTLAPTNDECVRGAFALEFDGSCTADAVVAAYTDQVFNAPGALTQSCAVDAAADLAAKLAAAGLADAAALCDDLYSTQHRVPFTDTTKRGTDLHFEKMFFDGRTDWQEEVETIYETEDRSATSILKEDAEQVKVFFDGIAQGRRVAWPGSLSNFQSAVKDADDLATCTTNAAMCCWPKDRQANDNNGNCASPYDNKCVDKDVADNTDLCFVDPARGNASTGFDSAEGLLVFPGDNNNGEGAVHCHGLAWSNDVNDKTARYKANNLFFVSMYDHMHNRGYVQNIPGAPMCGCVEQMPTVSRSDCTQVDLTETIKITYDPEAATPFASALTQVHVDFNACQGINNRNNDLWAYIARLYQQGDVTPAQFGEAGRIITDNGCSETTKYQLNNLGMSTGYDHDVAKWTKVAGRDALFDASPLGTTAFNTVVGSSLTPDTPIILRVCPHCTQTHKYVYYRRLTAIPAGFGVLDNILRYHSSSKPTGNVWTTDFTLHSTYDDAVSGASPWSCPNTQFNYRVNFVGDCSPSGARVTNQYTNFWWGHGPQLDVAYYVNAPEGAGVDEADLVSAAGLGAQYSSTDIGSPSKAGRVLVRAADDAIILTGSGWDIWDYHDQFHYLSQPWAGDVDVQVHISAFTGIVNSWAKAGLMLRGDDGNQATHALGLLSGNQGVTMMTRRSMRAWTNHIGGNYKTNPHQTSSWLRLVKIGTRVTFYYRNNEGDDWVERASDTIHFPDDTYHVGLAITSHDNNYLSEAVFEDYTVEQLTIPTPSPTGTAAPTGWDPLIYVGDARAGSISTHATNGITSYQAYGSGIWGASDSFLFNNVVRKDTADGAFDVVAYSDRFHTGYMYAKAGIMIRDSNDANAAHAFVGVSGYYLGVTFQTRAAAGENTVHHSTRFVHNHKAWMRLSKPANSNIITSYYKVNAGDAWTEIGSAEVNFTGDVLVGTAVTSGDPSGNGHVDYQEMGYNIIDNSA